MSVTNWKEELQRPGYGNTLLHAMFKPIGLGHVSIEIKEYLHVHLFTSAIGLGISLLIFVYILSTLYLSSLELLIFYTMSHLCVSKVRPLSRIYVTIVEF